MQKKDVLSVQYFEDAIRFADLINGFLFRGKNVVKESQVRECNRIILKKQKREGRLKTAMRIRDVIREVQIGNKVVMVSLENQADIHYAMPVRVMDGDCAVYTEQLRKRGKEHKEKRDLTGAEYLSGFGKEETLIPVVTVVVYFGKDPWDGPGNLKEMLDLSDVPEELEAAINDYSIHLLDVRRYEHLEHFQTDLRYVFGFLQNEQDGKKLKDFIKENRRALEHLAEDAYDFISVISQSEELVMMKSQNQNEEGDYDMCKGLREWMADERRQGEEKGKEIGKEIGIRLAKQVIRMDLTGVSREEIAKKCEITIEDVDQILDDEVA